MSKCPHAKSNYGCSALLDHGFAQNTLVIPENWWKQYCSAKNYSQCPNLKAALSMKQDRARRPAGGTLNSSGANSQGGQFVSKWRKNQKKNNPVHAHGGKVPHFCEKPWRAAEIRFRVTVSKFYTRPWIS
ncbi:hypothetical protein [Desulforamulus hydrothermalis]|uniref:Uncharacterized protein n=1 Tax=Desulforamulus hydrothermalis Lam5 = DSM 18033 TaxID=1121428 RepID=K8DZU7_9FIRM|nr:hypothetical protein [Desulforamulus hydrothermalis]CCO08682.1 conserved hypothetical protein [Desulforamulus hydrothermalis Lam5 = DSM 18033]SHH38633.1 hypothetical protein SAMN02745177_02377 [Desulforamulus hydrothermalis Lam5 = DSM 18033]